MRSLVLALSLLAASTVLATDFSGLEVVIPVVSRVAGANGTQWKTDVVVSNRSDVAATTVRMIYNPVGHPPLQSLFTLAPHGSFTMVDVILDRYGRQEGYGTIWLGSSTDEAKITAHARIYNTGNPAGEFGQLVQGMPYDKLTKTVWISGVIGIRNNRANLGIANPNNEIAKFTLSWYDKSGNEQGRRTNIFVQPWEVLLMNDIFSVLRSSPDEGVAFLLEADRPIYGYASIVRNDTGDAYTIMGDGTDQ
jgi:hypothetical protein